MQIENHIWYSPHLSLNMPLRVYGHWGAPLLVFPCSLGRYYDYEGMGMIDAITPFIDAGLVKLYCVESVDAETWYNFSVPPAERDRRYQDWAGYITGEVVPFIRKHCKDPGIRIMTNGCSMGAFHALNLFLKYPEHFAGCIGLSGLYRLDRREFGLSADDIGQVYFNSPIHYLAGMTDEGLLAQYRERDIIICVGQGAWEDETQEDARSLDHILHDKRIPAWVDFWGHDVDHDWPWWYQQMRYFLGHLYGEP